MTTVINPNNKKGPCGAIDCTEQGNYYNRTYALCVDHEYGTGPIRHGETFEQYQIIEKDFIEFMKYVPLMEKHFEVESPFLRDIILRCCVQIEIFFLEWAKVVAADQNTTLYEEYIYGNSKKAGRKPNNKGIKNWNINSYSYFSKKFEQNHWVYIVPLDRNIQPFDGWTAGNPPFWWDAYNKLKHDGHKNKHKANYKTALHALAALFELHCVHKGSRQYLTELVLTTVQLGMKSATVEYGLIATPVDSSKKLFQDDCLGSQKVELMTKEGFAKAMTNYTPKKTRI